MENVEKDCGFTRGNDWFRYRATAIIVENGCVLLAGNKSEDYFYSVGGGVHIGEKAEDACVREVFEETGIHYEIDRLAIIHVNFWRGNGAYDEGLNCHEVAFYYLMKPKNSGETDFTLTRSRFGDLENIYRIPIEELHKHKHFPTFLYGYLTNPHEGIVHIVTDERSVDG